MVKRILALTAVLVSLAALPAAAQTATRVAAGKDPVAEGRPLSEWIAELQARAPLNRNAAAYAISTLGPAAAPAVPALIKALDDESPSVRFPVTVALREIGPAAKAAVPRLKRMMDDEINDELAAAARRALRTIDPSAVPQSE